MARTMLYLCMLLVSLNASAEKTAFACLTAEAAGLTWMNGAWKVRPFLEQKFILVLEGDRLTKESVADVLTACLSAVLYKVSSRASDTDETWVAKNVPRGAASRHFVGRVELLHAGLGDLGKAGGPPDVHEHDARRLHEIVPDGGASGVITSPPYAGTYDYADHQRLRFDFLGLRHRGLDDGEIGSRRSFNKSGPAGESAWHDALTNSLRSIARVLTPGSYAAIIIGDSWAGGRAMYALDDVRSSLTDELGVAAWASQLRPMLGTGELRAFGDRPKAEHVILLRRG